MLRDFVGSIVVSELMLTCPTLFKVMEPFMSVAIDKMPELEKVPADESKVPEFTAMVALLLFDNVLELIRDRLRVTIPELEMVPELEIAAGMGLMKSSGYLRLDIVMVPKLEMVPEFEIIPEP